MSGGSRADRRASAARRPPGRRMLLHIAVASALLLVAGTGGASTPESNSGLDAYLPSSEEWVVEGEIQRADGEADLFAAIDGGAELYLRHGFRRALFAQIRFREQTRFNLAIFEMADPEAAKGAFGARTGGESPGPDLGDGSVVGEYYLIFRRGRFLVSLTGYEGTAAVRESLKAAAAGIAARMGE